MDLEDEIKSPQTDYPRGGMVIKKTQVQFWVEDLVFPPTLLKGFEDGEVNKEYLEKCGKDTVRRLPVLTPILWLSIMLVGLIQAFLFTMFAGFLEKSMEPCFTFSQLFNIALFSLTPSSAIIATYASIGFTQVSWSLIYFACYCFFVVMASGVCRTALLPPNERDGSNDLE